VFVQGQKEPRAPRLESDVGRVVVC
jgi:hypothetical protein